MRAWRTGSQRSPHATLAPRCANHCVHACRIRRAVGAAVSDASCVSFLSREFLALRDLLEPPPPSPDDVQTTTATPHLWPARLHPFSDGTFATRVWITTIRPAARVVDD